MSAPSLLIVEDDTAIRVGLEEKLTSEGYRVTTAVDGEGAIRELEDRAFDLVVLDLMLPKRDGLSVLRWLRLRDRDRPVLILSARGDESDKVEGLRSGADDYLAKPFGIAELLARIQALLRRAGRSGDTVSFGEVRIDLSEGRVWRRDVEVALRKKERDVLLYLARHRGRAVSREEILRGTSGLAASSAVRSIDFHILMLRRKLEVDPKRPEHIVTRHGEGFVLE